MRTANVVADASIFAALINAYAANREYGSVPRLIQEMKVPRTLCHGVPTRFPDRRERAALRQRAEANARADPLATAAWG